MKDITIVEYLKHWAQEKADDTAFNFLDDKVEVVSKISYAALNIKAQQTAKRLLSKVEKGDRVLILLPMGPEYLELLLGCFYAGVIAVPSYPPKNKKSSAEKIEHIIQNSSPSLIITEEKSLKWFEEEQYYNITESIESLLTSQPADALSLPEIDFDDIAFLQYSSGSTGNPKGVIITHRNIITNLGQIIQSFAATEEEILFSWLPVYHDMGLIGCMLMPLCVSVETYLMNPFDFIRQPYRWLEGISKYKATVSGAPNFAYELVAKKVDDERIAKLDLSSWRIAFNGAEPIRKDSVEKFIQKFSTCGFKSEAMHPVYGLAEAGLFVTGMESAEKPFYFHADTTMLQQHKMKPATGNENVKSIINVGKTWGDMQVKIVDADLLPCAENEIGEIVIAGQSVTQGYWKRDTPELFIDIDGTQYLRTQDMGSIVDGSLYITGRLKEMLIIRGKNYYPQDIEYAVHRSVPELQLDGGAAVLNNNGELVLIQELETSAYKKLSETAYKDLAYKAVQIVSEQFSLKLSDFILIKPMQIPKTSSGKIRRTHVAQLYADNKLSPLFQMRSTEKDGGSNVLSDECKDLVQWLKDYSRTRINSRLMDERRSISPHIILDLGRKGILGMEVPKSMGGLGFNTTESLAVIQQLASIDVTLASFVGVHVALGTRPILNYGSPRLKNKWIRDIAEGRVLSAFAITEDNAGSNPASMESVAVKKENGWLLNGSKKWIGSAAWSNVIIVITQTVNERNEPEGLSAFAVETEQPGVEITEEHLTMGVRAMVQNSISFNDVQLTGDQLIGEAGQGMIIAQDAMNSGRLGIGAMALGAMKKGLQMSLSYAGKRTISTGKLINNPVTNRTLRKQWYAVTCSQALIDTAAAYAQESETMYRNLSMICKVFASEQLSSVLDSSMQLLGGRGYIENNLLAQFYRDGRLLRIFEGPTETLTSFLGADFLNNRGQWEHFFSTSEKDRSYLDELKKMVENIRSSSDLPGAAATKNLVKYEVGRLLILHVAKTSVAQHERSATALEVEGWLDVEIENALAEWRWGMKPTAALQDMYTLEKQLAEDIGELYTPVQQDFGKAAPLIFEYTKKAPSVSKVIPIEDKHIIPETDAGNEEGLPELQADIVRSITGVLVTETGIDKNEITPERPFSSYGIDSIDAVSLIVAIEQKYNIVLDPSLFWKHPTIAELSEVLAQKIKSNNSSNNSIAI